MNIKTLEDLLDYLIEYLKKYPYMGTTQIRNEMLRLKKEIKK